MIKIARTKPESFTKLITALIKTFLVFTSCGSRGGDEDELKDFQSFFLRWKLESRMTQSQTLTVRVGDHFLSVVF